MDEMDIDALDSQTATLRITLDLRPRNVQDLRSRGRGAWIPQTTASAAASTPKPTPSKNDDDDGQQSVQWADVDEDDDASTVKGSNDEYSTEEDGMVISHIEESVYSEVEYRDNNYRGNKLIKANQSNSIRTKFERYANELVDPALQPRDSAKMFKAEVEQALPLIKQLAELVAICDTKEEVSILPWRQFAKRLEREGEAGSEIMQISPGEVYVAIRKEMSQRRGQTMGSPECRSRSRSFASGQAATNATVPRKRFLWLYPEHIFRRHSRQPLRYCQPLLCAALN